MHAQTPALVSVEEAAIGLGVSPRTVRRWLQAQRLEGQKVGGTWNVVWMTTSLEEGRQTVRLESALTLRQRLRDVGERLITVGNAVAGGRRQRGQVFLTWRRARSLHVVFAIGRHRPPHHWAPQALGTELPFWLRERVRWHAVVPLLRRYERLRQWCHARLLCCPGVATVLMAELEQLDVAVEHLAGLREMGAASPRDPGNQKAHERRKSALP